MKDHETGCTDRAEVLKTTDGATLVAQVYRPHFRPRALLLLNGATGVPQNYYRAFAKYAAREHDLAVMTYDYRDMGRSASGPVRRSRARMSDWGLQDQEGASAKAARLFPGLPIWILGHSLGGMTLPLQRDFGVVERIITVASGNVHHNDHPWPYRATALAFWYGPGAMATAALGYLPGRILGLGSDLPAPAYWQWRKWCTSRDTFGYEAGRALPNVQWDAPGIALKLIAFADDEVIPPECVSRHAKNFGMDGEAVQVIAPGDFGLARIGHIGAFARRCQAIWDEVLK